MFVLVSIGYHLKYCISNLRLLPLLGNLNKHKNGYNTAQYVDIELKCVIGAQSHSQHQVIMDLTLWLLTIGVNLVCLLAKYFMTYFCEAILDQGWVTFFPKAKFKK